jgi:hypothetical protein
MSFEIQFTADDGVDGEASTITIVHEAAPVPRIGELVAFNLGGKRETFEVFDVEWEIKDYDQPDGVGGTERATRMRAHVHCSHWSGKGHTWRKP